MISQVIHWKATSYLKISDLKIFFRYNSLHWWYININLDHGFKSLNHPALDQDSTGISNIWKPGWKQADACKMFILFQNSSIYACKVPLFVDFANSRLPLKNCPFFAKVGTSVVLARIWLRKILCSWTHYWVSHWPGQGELINQIKCVKECALN